MCFFLVFTCGCNHVEIASFLCLARAEYLSNNHFDHISLLKRFQKTFKKRSQRTGKLSALLDDDDGESDAKGSEDENEESEKVRKERVSYSQGTDKGYVTLK